MKLANNNLQINFWMSNATWIFVIAILCITGGSTSTILFFGGTTVAIIVSMFITGFPSSTIAFSWHSLIFPLFWLLLAFGVILSRNPNAGLNFLMSNLQFLCLPLVILGLQQTLKIDYLTLFIRGVAVALPIAFLTGIAQRTIFMPPSLGGAMGNILVYTTICMTAGWISLIGIHREKLFWKIIQILGFLSSIGIIVLGLRKSSLLCLPIMITIGTFYFYKVNALNFKKTITFIFLITIFAVVGVLVVGQKGVYLKNRISKPIQLLQKNGFTPAGILDEKRLLMAEGGLKLFLEKPITGVGGHNNFTAAKRKLSPKQRRALGGAKTHLHNDYLTIAVSSGIFGLLGFLAILITPIIIALRSKKDEKYWDRLAFAQFVCLSNMIFALTNKLITQDLLLTFFCTSIAILYIACHQANTDTDLLLEKPKE